MPLILTVLGAGFIGGLIPAGLLPASVLSIERDYGLSHAEMGRVVGLCMVLGGSTGGLAGGWLCGHVGALRNILLALLVTTAALATIGLVPSLAATVGGLAVYFCAMGFAGSSNTLAAHMLPDRQRGIALLHATNATGKLTGPLLASLFLATTWRSSFLAAAVLPVLIAIPALMAHSNGETSVGRKTDDARRPGVGFWAAISGFGFIAGGEIAIALWLPAYGQKVRHFSAGHSNALLSVFLLGLIAGRLAVGAMSKRVSPMAVLAVCGVLLVSVVPAVMCGSYAGAVALFLLTGLGVSSVWPSYFAHLTTVYPQHIGLMGGASISSTQLGFAACSMISGQIADVHIPWSILFGAAVVGAFVAAFFLSPISKSRKGGMIS